MVLNPDHAIAVRYTHPAVKATIKKVEAEETLGSWKTSECFFHCFGCSEDFSGCF
jgi:hypothetical protein